MKNLKERMYRLMMSVIYLGALLLIIFLWKRFFNIEKGVDGMLFWFMFMAPLTAVVFCQFIITTISIIINNKGWQFAIYLLIISSLSFSPLIFKSAADWWIFLLMYLIFILPTAICVVCAEHIEKFGAAYCCMFFSWLFFGLAYNHDNEYLD